jgi:hypothetical protein
LEIVDIGDVAIDKISIRVDDRIESGPVDEDQIMTVIVFYLLELRQSFRFLVDDPALKITNIIDLATVSIDIGTSCLFVDLETFIRVFTTKVTIEVANSRRFSCI